MRNVVKSEKYGSVLYEESFWTGKRKIYINGELFEKDTKKIYIGKIDDKITAINICGNFFTGVKLEINSDIIQVTPSTLWYEYVLFILSFLIVLVWGNSFALCRIIPVVGGAIGGFIAGLGAFLSLFAMKSVKKPLYKVLIGIGSLIAIFGICALIGLAIVSAI